MKEIPIQQALADVRQLHNRWMEAVDKCKYNPAWLRIANLYWARLKCYKARIKRTQDEYRNYSETYKKMLGIDNWLINLN